MTKSTDPIVTTDPWSELRRFTDARISLGRCGSSLPLAESLAFKLAHAQARDAVWQPFEAEALAARVRDMGEDCLLLSSVVADRGEYLTRPDKGRRLDEPSRAALADAPKGRDVCLVVCDGLSSRAVHENAAPFLECFLAYLNTTALTHAPVCLVANGRVAVADEVAALMEARLVVNLIGERPGLSSPDSLGVYMTYAAVPGTTDESRNCISNVRTGGLPVEEGARKLAYLVENAFAMKLSGVRLKDKMPAAYLPFQETPKAVAE